MDDLAPSKVSAAAAYASWAAAAASASAKRRGGSISERTLALYRNIWDQWLKALPRGVDWDSAEPDHVRGFLSGLASSAGSSTRSRRAASPVTQHRYFRVLREVYQHAQIMDWVATNPCAEDASPSPGEAMDSMILPPHALAAMRAEILRRHGAGQHANWQSLRDQALLAVLLATGAKTSEAQRLRADSLSPVQKPGAPMALVIHLEGSRKSQRRSILIEDTGLQDVVEAWQTERLGVAGASPYLFFGQKHRSDAALGKIRSPLSGNSIFMLISKFVQETLPAGYFEGELAHIGPETIRNSVLAGWLDAGVPEAEVRERAGLKESRAIKRLIRSRT